MNLELIVAVDPDGMLHCARTSTKPVRRRGGRTLPAVTTITGLCVRGTGAVLTTPLEIVDLDDRGPGSAWCPECAGYLDHLDQARAAEVAKFVAMREIALDPTSVTARNAAAMAALGEQLTGVPAGELLAHAADRADPDYPYDVLRSVRLTDSRDGVTRQVYPPVDDELAARRELRRLAAEGDAG